MMPIQILQWRVQQTHEPHNPCHQGQSELRPQQEIFLSSTLSGTANRRGLQNNRWWIEYHLEPDYRLMESGSVWLRGCRTHQRRQYPNLCVEVGICVQTRARVCMPGLVCTQIYQFESIPSINMWRMFTRSEVAAGVAEAHERKAKLMSQRVIDVKRVIWCAQRVTVKCNIDIRFEHAALSIGNSCGHCSDLGGTIRSRRVSAKVVSTVPHVQLAFKESRLDGLQTPCHRAALPWIRPSKLQGHVAQQMVTGRLEDLR